MGNPRCARVASFHRLPRTSSTAGPKLAVFLHHLEHGEDVRDRGLGLEVVYRAEDEAAAGAEDIDPRAELVPHLLRLAERQSLLRVHAAAPEDQLVTIVLLERARVHAFGGALD